LKYKSNTSYQALSASDINNFQDRVARGELDVNNRHPHFEELEFALQRFNDESRFSVVPSPDTIRNALNAISMATMRGVITVREAESLLSSEPGQPEEPFVQEVRRLIVMQPNESNITSFQGDVGQISIIHNNAIKEINSKNIPEESKSRVRKIVDFVKNHYSFLMRLADEALKRIPSS
jgi:hypothetical protein